MKLSEYDRELLSGGQGRAKQIAMEIVCRMGELYHAPELISITRAHIDGCSYTAVWDAGLEFAEMLAEAGGKAVYQYVELGQHCEEHLHLKCVKCGCIIHLDCGFMDEIAEHIQKDHGFQLQCKNSILYGICKDCRRE